MIEQRKNPWGPETSYKTFEEYWEFEVIASMVMKWRELTGEDIVFENVQKEDERIIELIRKYDEEIEKIGDFGTGAS